MGAEPGRRFLKQPAAKLEPVIVPCITVVQSVHPIRKSPASYNHSTKRNPWSPPTYSIGMGFDS